MGCKELRYKVIHRFRDRFTVEELCKLLEVSRSGYYKWLKRKDEPDKDKVIADLIVECHEKAHRTYGYRRVKMWLLRETGLVINHKAVYESCANTTCWLYENANGFVIMIVTPIHITTMN